jgi:hypothetical protein
MNTPERHLRLGQFACLLVILTCFKVAMGVEKSSREVTWVQWVVIAMALWAAVSGVTLQCRIVRHHDKPRRGPTRSTPFTRWRAGHLVRLSCATSVALWGLVLRENGGPMWVVNTLFGLGTVLLLVWRPGVSPEQSQSS